MPRQLSMPTAKEYDVYYQRYFKYINGDPIELLSKQLDIYIDFIKANSERMDYRYAEDKWSIRESLIHIIDTEQIFAYRALRFSRGDKSPLAGFDQDDFITGNNFDHITPLDIIEEFSLQRKATLSMIKRFTEEEVDRIGVASNSNMSVRAAIYVIAGHAEHHLELFNKKYL